MAMGIISDEAFEKELTNCVLPSPSINSSVESPNGSVVTIDKPGRNIGDKNVPPALRKIIGETSELDGRNEAVQLAKQFGISRSSVSAYAHGAHSTDTYHEPKKELTNHINGAKERVSKKARARLMMALNHLTPDKMESAKAVEVANIAKAMSGIVKDMEPENNAPVTNNGPNITIYAPQLRSEQHFEFIQVQE